MIVTKIKESPTLQEFKTWLAEFKLNPVDQHIQYKQNLKGYVLGALFLDAVLTDFDNAQLLNSINTLMIESNLKFVFEHNAMSHCYNLIDAGKELTASQLNFLEFVASNMELESIGAQVFSDLKFFPQFRVDRLCSKFLITLLGNESYINLFRGKQAEFKSSFVRVALTCLKNKCSSQDDLDRLLAVAKFSVKLYSGVMTDLAKIVKSHCLDSQSFSGKVFFWCDQLDSVYKAFYGEIGKTDRKPVQKFIRDFKELAFEQLEEDIVPYITVDNFLKVCDSTIEVGGLNELVSMYYGNKKPTYSNYAYYRNAEAYFWNLWLNGRLPIYKLPEGCRQKISTALCKAFSDKVNVLNKAGLFSKQTGPKNIHDSMSVVCLDWFVESKDVASIFKEDGLFAGRSDLIKIAYFFKALKACFKNEFTTRELMLEQLNTSIKGWYDLGKSLPYELQWLYIHLRTIKQGISLNSFMAQTKLISSYYADQFLIVGKFSPYDHKGGFSYQSYVKACEMQQLLLPGTLIELHEKNSNQVEFSKSNWKSQTLATMHLVYLYGNDINALTTAIDGYCQSHPKHDKAKAFHELGQFSVPMVEVEKIKSYRPYFLKYPKLLKLASNLGFAPNAIENEDIECIRSKLLTVTYVGVPESLSSHMEHAITNGWTQEIVNEFVDIVCRKGKHRVDIPELIIEQDEWVIRSLNKEDPRHLYIGELSGCCQHINEGAGAEAAVQSFIESWCSVLVIENNRTKKLYAQSFIWFNEQKDIIVLDSIESIYEDSNPVVSSIISPAILAWAKIMKTNNNIDVAISDTDYGITYKIRQLLGKQSISTNPFKELEYSDVESSVYVIT